MDNLSSVSQHFLRPTVPAFVCQIQFLASWYPLPSFSFLVKLNMHSLCRVSTQTAHCSYTLQGCRCSLPLLLHVGKSELIEWWWSCKSSLLSNFKSPCASWQIVDPTRSEHPYPAPNMVHFGHSNNILWRRIGLPLEGACWVQGGEWFCCTAKGTAETIPSRWGEAHGARVLHQAGENCWG